MSYSYPEPYRSRSNTVLNAAVATIGVAIVVAFGLADKAISDRNAKAPPTIQQQQNLYLLEQAVKNPSLHGIECDVGDATGYSSYPELQDPKFVRSLKQEIRENPDEACRVFGPINFPPSLDRN